MITPHERKLVLEMLKRKGNAFNALGRLGGFVAGSFFVYYGVPTFWWWFMLTLLILNSIRKTNRYLHMSDAEL